ncbi:MAG: beta-galactosidase, partial [Kiritimatiellae bacterium]|nr:beta-galactosidase [Kiritimatiellia bacterium]
YGADFRTRWFERSYTRFVSWGFNTIGAFSSWETLSNGKIPYTATVWVGGDFARIRTGSEQVRAMPDPFDPEFAASVARAVRPQAQRIQDDPWFLGYFVGNEEHWGYHHAGPRSHYTLVLTALRMSAETSPAKQAFLKRLGEEHGSIDALNVAWNTSFTDWEALREPLTFSTPYSPGLLEDFSRLLTLYAEHYFRVVQAGLKKYSPNHLYLGCRFAGYSPEVLAAAATYSDVFSFNLYRLTLEPEEFAFLEAYDMPVLVGEFHFGAPDRGVWDTGLLGVVDQEARGTAYQNYLKSVLALPNFVGAHWFQYTDQPATGRPMDGENGNLGFISITDTPYPELIDAAREIHTDIYRIRFGD